LECTVCDEIGGKVMQKLMQPADYLLGRKTFEIFASFWPFKLPHFPSLKKIL